MAENALEFEHRDLHWGNVLICRTEDEFVESTLLGEKKLVPSHGVRVSLIDFTLSRLKKGTKNKLHDVHNKLSIIGERSDFRAKGFVQEFNAIPLSQHACPHVYSTAL